jgi:hypothetical protein
MQLEEMQRQRMGIKKLVNRPPRKEDVNIVVIDQCGEHDFFIIPAKKFPHSEKLMGFLNFVKFQYSMKLDMRLTAKEESQEVKKYGEKVDRAISIHEELIQWLYGRGMKYLMQKRDAFAGSYNCFGWVDVIHKCFRYV